MHELEVPRVTLQTGLHVLDLLGVLAFSMSGALLAVRKRFDLFGVLVLGCVTAVGGGAIRDTLTGQTPPLFLRDETYLWFALLGSVLAFAFGERLARFERTLSVFDTLGLALFAASGALGALNFGLGPLGVIFAGMLSGVGGGVIRDLIANEVPEIMYRHDQLYATAAAAGAAAVYLLHPVLTPFQAQLAGALVVILLRWLSRRGWVRLPVRRLPGE
ncbi:trimeric intracellular cation channel family protein [Deinococcus sp. DB0503]|uniref:trimeric intracellular cation channel family protein n=1 Tax=Deinococcus sp. DB0503 TaxID=2479203 RepID=UPI0018DFF67C|nr:trimeric intracellular cation channel family protein [Deinococcus sp. DB0503]MBI0445169.1 trimeric intracellular cation channel family protein [Deinococcus sp. DB0503]